MKNFKISRNSTYFKKVICLQQTANSVDLKPEQKHTKLLGSPYSECADNNESSHCSRNLAEETIRNRCGCRYGLIHADAGTEVSNY